MPLDRRARRFLDMAAVAGAARSRPGEPDVADMRAGLEALAAFAGAPRLPDALSRDVTLAGSTIPARVYSPADAREGERLPGLVYFHGGGWIAGGLDSHDGIARALAAESGCRVVAVDYRLAPEHRFPQGLDDCRAALSIVHANAAEFGLNPARIGVAGDSAGANLAVVVCQRARQSGPPIALQLLLCPVMEPLGRTASRESLASGYFLEERTMERYWELYRVNGLAPDDPDVAPLRARDLSGLPPAIIHTAEFDLLCDEGALYAEKLTAAGVSAQLHQHAGMIHHFYGLGGAIPYVAQAWAMIGAQVREALR